MAKKKLLDSEQIIAGQITINKLKTEVRKNIIGQEELLDNIIMVMIEGGHILVEGVPGLAKTLVVKSLAASINADFKRIQFTPDLLPADLTGTLIYRPQTSEFVPRKGPVFTQILLADEINRAPAKVQSALLESMEESQVTIGEESYSLPDNFFVMATQNPLDEEGTYQLPHAQLDRFTMKSVLRYPQPNEELEILNNLGTTKAKKISPVLGTSDIVALRKLAYSIEIDRHISQYIISIVNASREQNRQRLEFVRFLEYGVSPRASLALYRCSLIEAFFQGRSFVLPEDVKKMAPLVLRHRLVLSYEAEAEGRSPDDIISSILKNVAVP